MSERRPAEYVANQHLHLTGALSMEYLRRAREAANLRAEDFDDLNPSDFDAPGIWALAKEVTSTPSGFEAAINHVVVSQRNEGVDAVELTFNPYGMLKRGMTPDTIATAAFNAVTFAAERGTSLSLRPGVNRKDGPASIVDVRAVYEAMSPETVFGIDLNGDERRFPTEPFINGFRDLMERDIPVSLHAGELPGTEASLSAALGLRPQRLGHAVVAGGNGQLLDELLQSGSTVEVALTSNLIRGVVPSIEEHPVRQFTERGIPVVFGTDDPTFFGNTMASEYELLEKAGVSIRAGEGEGM